MRRRRSPEIIAGRVNADGSIAAGDGFTVAKGSTGNWTVTLTPGMRLVGATATSLVFGNNANVGSFSERGFVVGMGTNAGAAADQPWSFIAAGVQQ